MGNYEKLQELSELRASLLQTANPENAEQQKKLGKLLVRERISKLLDEGSFIELGKYVQNSNAVYGFKDTSAPTDGVITGFGSIEGRPVYVFAQDYTVLKGALGLSHARKIVDVIDRAVKSGVPVIGMMDSDGAKVQEGAAALSGYAMIMKKLSEVSGIIPTISMVLGNAIGCGSYISALCDFMVIVDKVGALLTHGPQVLSANEGMNKTAVELGGAQVHGGQTGLADFVCGTEDEAFAIVKKLLTYLPSNNLDEAPFEMCNDDLNRPLLNMNAESYDMRALVAELADNGQFFEIKADFAKNIITGFAQLNGTSVGIVANVPGQQLDQDACKKAARFISLLDAYSIPVISLIDNEGTVIDLEQEQTGLISAVAKLAFAYAEVSSPMVSVVTGKAVGDGFAAMGSKALGADALYAWPSAKIAPLDEEAGSLIMFEDEIKQAEDGAQGRQKAVEEYLQLFANPYSAAKQGVVDDVIMPSETRQMVIGALEMALSKRENRIPKKHGVMPW